jgi:hypothetical protein
MFRCGFVPHAHKFFVIYNTREFSRDCFLDVLIFIREKHEHAQIVTDLFSDCGVIILTHVNEARVLMSVKNREFVQSSFPCIVVHCFVSRHVIPNNQGS